MTLRAVIVGGCLLAAGCSGGGDGGGDGSPSSLTAAAVTSTTAFTYPDAPSALSAAAAPAATKAFEGTVEELALSGLPTGRLDELVAAGDARHAWLISDLLRFTADTDAVDVLVRAFTELTGVDPFAHPAFADSPWKAVTDHLIAWDLPAPPDYRALKAALFTMVEPGWAPFFDDADADIDWRWLSWGGVSIDDRPLGDTAPCTGGCIPALDDPALTDADGGDWYPDDRLVFGIVEGDQVVALPKQIMEVHEMVNMTIGGRRFAIPYCTLCGSAHAYLTDELPAGVAEPVMRTSGLLSRSNKVMFDLNTMSVFDTFTGAAVSGPLQDAGVVLEQRTVSVAPWGEWRAAHPDTLIVAEDGGIERSYELDPLDGRDDDGPIFPIGDVDPRLPAQEPVVGVITADGVAVAFPTNEARTALAAGEDVTTAGVALAADGGGFRARTTDGAELPAHEAFWFAWSQFHPDTDLWSP